MNRSFSLALLILLLLGLLQACSPEVKLCLKSPCPQEPSPEPNIEPFVGTWVNEAPKPDQLVKFSIGQGLSYVRAWVYCEPEPCEIELVVPRYHVDYSGQGPALDLNGYDSVHDFYAVLFEPRAGRLRVMEPYVDSETRASYFFVKVKS